MSLLQQKPSLLGAVAIYCTNKCLDKKPWNNDMVKCTGGIKEQDLKDLAQGLFVFIKKLETSTLKTMFRKYEHRTYQRIIQKIGQFV